MNKTQIAKKFEHLPNEILVECFEYIHTTDLFYSFRQLNHRFNELIQILPFHINLQDIDKSVYDVFCAQILVNPDTQTRVYSLRLSNVNTPGQIKDFLSRFALDQFSHLCSLTFIDVQEENVQPLKETFPKLSQIITLNLLDSKLELNELESVLPIDNLQTLSLNSSMTFVKRTIPIKNLTVSTVSLNDICHLFQYTPLLEYLSVSYVPAEEFDLEYRQSARPMHLKHLNFVEFDLHFDDLADFLRTMSNLRNFTISSSSDSQMLDASRWQELITSSLPSLTKFQFRFEINYHVDTNIFLKRFEKFQSDFWVKEHQWLTECASSILTGSAMIYTIPYLTQWEQLPLRSTRYCDNPLIDYSQTFKNITELVISLIDISACGQYYFPNVTSLEIIDSQTIINREAEQNLAESLNSLINLSKLRHLRIPTDCESAQTTLLFRILQLAPQLSSLSLVGCSYQSLTAHPELSRYLAKIRKLDVTKFNFCSNHRSATIHSLCKVIPNLEQLKTNGDNINDLYFLFDHFSNLSSFCIYFKSTDYPQELEVFKKQLREQNGLLHETVLDFCPDFFVHLSVWLRKNERCSRI